MPVKVFRLKELIGSDGSLEDVTMEALVNKVIAMTTTTRQSGRRPGQFEVHLRHTNVQDELDWLPNIGTTEILRLVIKDSLQWGLSYARITANVVERAARDVAAAAAVVGPNGSNAAVGATGKRRADRQRFSQAKRE